MRKSNARKKAQKSIIYRQKKQKNRKKKQLKQLKKQLYAN